jgi:magnesium chelatase family protein
MQETYKHKVSGPILDRIDLWIEVPHIDYETLTALRTPHGETEAARTCISNARTKMNDRKKRFQSLPSTNASLSAKAIEESVHLSDEVRDLLKLSAARLNLSPRSYHRLVKVSRTIADLDGTEHIEVPHVLEALQYRVPV